MSSSKFHPPAPFAFGWVFGETELLVINANMHCHLHHHYLMCWVFVRAQSKKARLVSSQIEICHPNQSSNGNSVPYSQCLTSWKSWCPWVHLQSTSHDHFAGWHYLLTCSRSWLHACRCCTQLCWLFFGSPGCQYTKFVAELMLSPYSYAAFFASFLHVSTTWTFYSDSQE